MIKKITSRAYILQKQFAGVPKKSDLKLVEEEMPPLKNGEFIAEAVYLSVDPYMRAYAPGLKLGTTFIGTQIAKIIESKYEKFPLGKYVVGPFGWRTHTVVNDKIDTSQFPCYLLPDFQGLPLSLGIGLLGMPGNTAYFGLLELCQPKPGETVIVTGAAGAVGSAVGQIAKIKDCKVIGVAGSDEKGKWLVNDLKFDYFINYKKPNFRKTLHEVAPNGIDCYFDNVGGEISSIILQQMNDYGRIAVCGGISGYNSLGSSEVAKASLVQFPLVMKQLKMEGFLVWRWQDRWLEGIEQNKKWILEGKLKYRETITEGFDNMFQAFVEMLDGSNFGKAIVKV